MNCAHTGRVEILRLKIGSRKVVLSGNGTAMQRTAYKDLDDISKKVATMTKTPAAHAIHLARLLRAEPYPPGGVMAVRVGADSMATSSECATLVRGVDVYPSASGALDPVDRTAGAQSIPRGPVMSPMLDDRLRIALLASPHELDDLVGAEAVDRRDGVLTLLRIHDLHLAPIEDLAGSERWQHHPAVADLKWRLEHTFLDSVRSYDADRNWTLPSDPVRALRVIAQAERVPTLYHWLATSCSFDQLVQFIELEGGPDGGFDDLVAICQVGLDGDAKLELARNYWDEMGRGQADQVHTGLHRRLKTALGLRTLTRRAQPLEALERSALGSLLATNRALQFEMLGALGLIELQAGPRCRSVSAGLRRVSAPLDSLPFYEEHAMADPIHGKHWLEEVIAPLSAQRNASARMIEGARWRSNLNARFLERTARLVGGPADIVDPTSSFQTPVS